MSGRPAARVSKRLELGLALLAAVAVLLAPLVVVTYPPLTDLPLHAAQMAIFGRLADPAYGFAEQFQLQLVQAPSFGPYLVGGGLGRVLPIALAAKLTTALCVAMLPVGLASYFRAAGRSPMLGVVGLGLVWNQLTHWGFIGFVAATGLTLLAMSATLRLLREPTRRRSWALGLALLAVPLFHVSRAPIAVAAVILLAVAIYPATRRLWPIVPAVMPTLALLGAWWWTSSAPLGSLVFGRPDWSRLDNLTPRLWLAYVGDAGAAERALVTGLAAALVGSRFAPAGWSPSRLVAAGQRDPNPAERPLAWSVGVSAVPLVLALAHLGLYLTLPMSIGRWWYVFPREVLPAVLFLLAATPGLPRLVGIRMPLVAAVCVAAALHGGFITDQFQRFERLTTDFRHALSQTPARPRLMYLVFDHGDFPKRTSPFVHLPGWVQAEKGGSLSHHLVNLNLYPVAYRGGPHRRGLRTPPDLGEKWAWRPQDFRVEKHGAWFDTFLVRNRRVDPSVLFDRDPNVQLMGRFGTWYLYRRQTR